jgi:hypothetical protein
MNELNIKINKLQKAALVIALSAFTLSLVGYLSDPVQFFFSYLVNLTFWVSIALGGLFLLMVHHLTGAVWSVVLRRLLEMIQSSFILLAVLFLPVLFGIHELYHWSHSEAVAADKLLQLKSPFLNQSFFIIRSTGYFLVWIFLSRTLFNKSITQDDPSQPDPAPAMRRTSAYGMILFALTLTFASFDWLMSLDPHWYSTIYGVYFFSGCVLAALAFLTLTVLYMRKQGALTDAIGLAHLHDLGRLIFSFTVFWAYMAFSQYFLIWYGNIPEETVWFQHRWHGNWKAISLLLVLGHFVLPFFLLMMRWTKRNPIALASLSLWLLFMHWIDLFWLVMPSRPGHNDLFTWQDLATFLTIAGFFIWFFGRQTGRHPLLPMNDPRLSESKQLE